MVHADEALCDVDTALCLKVEEWKKVLAYVTEVGLAVNGKTHEVKSIEQFDIKTLLLHVECHEVCRDNLALCNDLLLEVVGQWLVSKVTEMAEHTVNDLSCRSSVLLSLVQFLDCLHIL